MAMVKYSTDHGASSGVRVERVHFNPATKMVLVRIRRQNEEGEEGMRAWHETEEGKLERRD